MRLEICVETLKIGVLEVERQQGNEDIDQEHVGSSPRERGENGQRFWVVFTQGTTDQTRRLELNSI